MTRPPKRIALQTNSRVLDRVLKMTASASGDPGIQKLVSIFSIEGPQQFLLYVRLSRSARACREAGQNCRLSPWLVSSARWLEGVPMRFRGPCDQNNGASNAAMMYLDA
jgi:hypothetical protein